MALLALGMVLVAPAFLLGIQLDDYFHWGLVQAKHEVLASPSPGSFWGLFTFLTGDPVRLEQLMDLGLVPWWTATNIEYAFWRPLTELTHGLDYWLWPQQPGLMHIHSLVYYGLVIGLAARLFAQLQPGAWIMALALFVLSYSHGVPAAWLANRNAVLATLFVILMLQQHHRVQQAGRGPVSWLALCWFLCALLCGEIAVCGGGYLLAYAMTLSSGPWLRRLGTLVPYGIVGLSWLLLRDYFGYGAAGSGHYLDPLGSFSLFVSALGSRLGELLAGLLWVLPPEFFTGQAWFPWLGAGLSLLLVVLIWPLLRSNAVARFWLLGAGFSLLPVTATIPHSRLLMVASLGVAGLLALVVQRSWRQLLASNWQQRSLKVLVSLLLVFHIGLSGLLLPLEAYSIKWIGDQMVNKAALQWEWDPGTSQDTAVILNPPMSSLAGYINGVRTYYELPVPARTWWLASGSFPLTIEQQGPQTLIIRQPQGLYLAQHEGVLRGGQYPFKIGDEVTLSGLSIQVLEVEQGVPVSAKYEFDAPLNQANGYQLLHWNSGRLTPCQLPPQGQSFELELSATQCYQPESLNP